MTVGSLLASMSSSELTEWMAFASIDPFDESRADLRAGTVAAAVVNHAHAEAGAPKKPAAPIDFMPFAESRRKRDEPILLADPEAQTQLIKKMVFGKTD